MIFLSTPSARRATAGALGTAYASNISIHALREEGDTAWHNFLPQKLNFYPRPPRGGRPSRDVDGQRVIGISIHALREEGDGFCRVRGASSCGISIHALREEGDPTPTTADGRAAYFYPRPPRGGRPRGRKNPARCARISIHALREDGADVIKGLLAMSGKFLSTPSARRATCAELAELAPQVISIHALREEGDSLK